MKTPDSNLLVWVGEGAVWIKVEGRANFHCSVDFKALVSCLWQRGYQCFRLDLSNCLLMDSTFLGVLSGFGLKMATARQNGEQPAIHLHNVNTRIFDLLENLGVAHLFQVRKDGEAKPAGEYVPQTPSTPDHEKMMRTSLTAHEDLMKINPENIHKFKDVARFLAEDLKKLDEEKNKEMPDKGTPGGQAGSNP